MAVRIWIVVFLIQSIVRFGVVEVHGASIRRAQEDSEDSVSSSSIQQQHNWPLDEEEEGYQGDQGREEASLLHLPFAYSHLDDKQQSEDNDDPPIGMREQDLWTLGALIPELQHLNDVSVKRDEDGEQAVSGSQEDSSEKNNNSTLSALFILEHPTSEEEMIDEESNS